MQVKNPWTWEILFWQVNCVLTNHNKVQDTRANLKTTNSVTVADWGLVFSRLMCTCFPCYTLTFHKYFWCSRFPESHSKCVLWLYAFLDLFNNINLCTVLIHHPKYAVYQLRVSQRRKNVIVHHVYLFGGFLKTTEEIKINYNETRKDGEDLHGL